MVLMVVRVEFVRLDRIFKGAMCPFFYASVAQWIEQQFPVLRVGGSIPLGGANFIYF